MNGWTGAIVSLLVAVNPVGVRRAVAWIDGERADGRRHALVVTPALGAVLIVIGLAADPLLDLLDVTTPTFRLAAAVVIGITSAKWMIAPTPPLLDIAHARQATITLATLVVTPAPVLASVAATADAGIAAGVVATIIPITLLVGVLASRPIPEPANGAAVRMIGALGIVAAVAIGIDAARTV